MKLLNFYSELLKLALCDVDVNNVVRVKDTNKLAVIETGRLVLPTNENLKNRDGERLAVFNPLKEDFKKIDAVTTEYQKLVTVFINSRVTEVMLTLLKVLNRQDLHSKLLTDDQMSLLELHTEVDEKSVNNFEKMIETIISKNDKPFISLYIKNNGKVGEQVYAKTCITTSSFIDNLENYKTLGIRKLDRDLYVKLFNYVILGDTHKFNTGSDLNIAPGFFSLIKTVEKLHSRLNHLNELFSDLISENYEIIEKVIDLSVISSLENFTDFANELRGIPVQINEADLSPPVPIVVEPIVNDIKSPMQLQFNKGIDLEDEIKNVIRSGNKQSVTKQLPTKKNMNNSVYSNGQPVMFDINGQVVPEQEIYPQPTTYPSGKAVRLYKDGSVVPEHIAYPNIQPPMVQQQHPFYNQQQAQVRGNIPTPMINNNRPFNARQAGLHNNTQPNFGQNSWGQPQAPVGINAAVCFNIKRAVYYPDATIPDIDNNGFIIPNQKYPPGTPLWWGPNEPCQIDGYGNILPPQQMQQMRQQFTQPASFGSGFNQGGSFGGSVNNGSNVMNSAGNGNIPNNPVDFRSL